MANHNLNRLTEDIKREISTALPEIKDKRISNEIVSVSHIELTSDLSYCKVYISVLGSKRKTEEAVECLEKAAGFFIRRINGRIKMRKMPKLIFLPDNSLEYAAHIENIISKLPKPAQTDDTEELSEEEYDED